MPLRIDYVGEGRSDELIARRLIEAVGAEPGLCFNKAGRPAGKQALDAHLGGLNRRAQLGHVVLALRDLDEDARCPGLLVKTLLPERSATMALRICVRSAETWLLADTDSYADFAGCRSNDLPSEPESLPNPKRAIVALLAAGRLPKLGRFAAERRKAGVPLWNILGTWHAEFAGSAWDPIRASESGIAPSLTRCVKRLSAYGT